MKGDNTDFNLIRGLFLNAIYGGRVDNDFDLKVLSEYLLLAFNKEAMQKVSLMQYLTPPENNVSSVMTQIQAIKDFDTPEMFGLPSDVEKNIMRFRTIEINHQLKSIQLSLEDLVNKQEIANNI